MAWKEGTCSRIEIYTSVFLQYLVGCCWACVRVFVDDEDLAETQESSDVAASADVDVDESLFEDLEDLGFDADLDIT